MVTTTRRRGASVRALRFDNGVLRAIDQTALPAQERELLLRTPVDVADAIKRLSIRGAPLIGVAGGYGVALACALDPSRESVQSASELLANARPTAVNLARAVGRVSAAAVAADDDAARAPAALAQARAIEAEEVAASDAIARHGAELLSAARRILTHCNTGALAAPGRGTALAVVAELAERGTLSKALATESRPLLQGARLTVWELARLGIEHELMVDSAAAGLLARGAADAVIVGCDRVAANGDVANKVGTYGLALAAHAAQIPFVVAGPISTIDYDCPDGAGIAIEERDADEVRFAPASARPLTIPDTSCRNPAFDVTPAALVTALVTDRGVASPVDAASVAALQPA
jgi:methylthioribose-1-phosphate isomerase